MILAVQFIPGLTDYKALAAEFKKRGNLSNHVLLVLSEAEHEEEAYQFGTEIVDLFGHSVFKALPIMERRKAQLANDLFRHAVWFTMRYKPEDGEIADPALLYFDPTYRPSKTGWLDAIQSEYYLMRAPYAFGSSKPDVEGARIFNGPMVVSKEYGPTSGLLDFIPENVHWRNHLRWEFSKNSRETRLIGQGAESVLKLPPFKK